jgi:hypothetical protein
MASAVRSFGNLAASAIAGLDRRLSAIGLPLSCSVDGLALVGLLLAGHRHWTTSGKGE